jgi:DNA processing protein
MGASLRYKIGLSLIPGLSPQKVRMLLDRFGSAEAIFSENNLKDAQDLNPSIRENILRAETLQKAEKELEIIDKKGIRVRFLLDEDYPLRLQSCADAPIILYSRGNSNLNTQKVVSIVGTRHSTPYGRELTQQVVRDLAQAFPETIIVSGLAYGIDICAHRAALDYGLNTVAVLAHGLHDIYPPAHRRTADDLLNNGSLVTELSWGTPSEAWRFVQRNRIVAGMCDACVIMESANKGGSLITGQMARDYNRDVFAFPGRPLDVYSKGCNLLIKKQTAALVESAEDIIREMNWDICSKKDTGQTSLFPMLDPMQEKILRLLKPGEKYSGNDLSIEANLKVEETLSSLVLLEMEDLVESLPGGFYRKKSN